jgi:hypothetical protein
MGDLHEAMTAFEAAARDPSCALEAIATIARIQWGLGLHEAYRESSVRALDEGCGVPNPLGIYQRSALALRAGDYANGWRDFESRWRLPHFERPALWRAMHSTPFWNGRANVGTLLIAHDGGFGDVIMMLRYVPHLRRHARRLVLAVKPQLSQLIADSFGDLAIDIVGHDSAVTGIDAWAPSMSLPAICGTTIETIPPAPYLRTPAAAVRRELPPGSLRVGVVWAASDHDKTADRTCPLANLAPLLAIDDVAFCSLQVGPRANDGEGGGLHRVLSDTPTFAETAGVIAQLDLIVTVDTSVAHLAGALAAPTLVLLPIGSDWRWGMHPNVTPWYPTARLIRQTVFGDWRGVAERATTEVRCRRDAMPARPASSGIAA